VGIRNVSVGAFSQFAGNTGNSNVCVGYYNLIVNNGSYNVAIGDRSLRCNNASNNTAVGFYALRSNTTGASNIAIGLNAQCTISTGVNNTIAIGVGAVTSATTNHAVWGNSGNTCNCVYAAWSTVSDLRDKTNVKTLSDKYGLALIKKLRPVAFNWDHRETYVRECKYEYGQKDGNLAGTKEHYGLIAQELRDVLTELDVKFDGLGHDDEKDAYRLTYEELIAPIIKSIQELIEENDKIKEILERNNIK
jgi:hypothetical protein